MGLTIKKIGIMADFTYNLEDISKEKSDFDVFWLHVENELKDPEFTIRFTEGDPKKRYCTLLVDERKSGEEVYAERYLVAEITDKDYNYMKKGYETSLRGLFFGSQSLYLEDITPEGDIVESVKVANIGDLPDDYLPSDEYTFSLD